MKKNKSLLASAFLILSSIIATAQNSPDLETIKNSGNYIFGIGVGDAIPEADDAAIQRLVSQISVEVESSYKNFIEETDDDLNEYTKIVVKTYSSTSLQNAERRILEENKQGKIRILRYIRKSDLDNIFKNRKKKVIDYYHYGKEAEKENRIGDALKNYYWSLVLLRSHPKNKSIKIDTKSGERLLMPLLNNNLERLLGNLSFSVEKIVNNTNQKKKTIVLSIKYNEFPVVNLDYKYYAGDTYSNIISAKDGTGIVELYDASAESFDKLQIYVEYKYKHKLGIDRELQRVMEDTKIPGYSSSKVKLTINDTNVIVSNNSDGSKKVKAEKSLQKAEQERLSCQNPKDYLAITHKVIESIKHKNYTNIRKHFTSDGYRMFEKLIQNGNVTVLSDDTSALYVMKFNDFVAVRAIPMVFRFHSNTRKFVENVVLTYNQNKKIESLSYALGYQAVKDILGQADKWGSMQEKYTLIHFMENYKTAYSLKRLDYLKQVFHEDALIIVGHMLRKDNRKMVDDMYCDLSNQKVEYIKMSKDEYMQHLSRVFRSNEFINIDFEDNEVKRLQNKQIYGIQINQHYYSSTYADKGYLFLMIDLQDTSNARIYVRSWQPEKFEDGSVIGLDDFHF